MMDYNGHDLGPAAVKRNDDLEGGIRAVLQPGQTMFWDGDTIHRGVYRPQQERLTLHNGWGSVDRSNPPEKKVCDNRFLHWCHPGTRDYLAAVEGSAVPGVLASAWDNYMSKQIVPRQCKEWNAAHPADVPPEYDPVAAADEEIQLREAGSSSSAW